MSRIGKLPIPVPTGATINISGQTVEAKGPKGVLSLVLPDLITPSLEDGEITLMPRKDIVENAEARMAEIESRGRKKMTFAEALEKTTRAQWGTARSSVANMVAGVNEGFTKLLELHGVGYRAQMQGKNLKLALGFSHDVFFTAPEGIEIKVAKPTEIAISGIDKQMVGQVAAEIRNFRPPEPYKGKGIRYAGEYVRRKEGKKK